MRVAARFHAPVGWILGMLAFSGTFSPASTAQERPQATEDKAQVDWESPENEIKLGKLFGLQIEAQLKLVRDPLVNEYVSGIGQKLARECQASFPVTLKLYDGDEVEGYVLPGGFLYLSSRLVLAVDDEAELAGVIAHVLAHTCGHDFVRGTARREPVHMVCLPPVDRTRPAWIRHLPWSPPARFIQTFPERVEAAADDLALGYLDRAGYDPRSFTASLARLDALEQERPGTIAFSFYSHLQAHNRDRRSAGKARAFARKTQYLVNSSEFDAVKERLLASQYRPSLPPFSISISALQDSIPAGAPLELAITLTNTSNRGITFFESDTFPFQIVVRDAEGKLLPASADSDCKCPALVCSETYGPDFIEAGEKITSHRVVSDFFDMSKPGVYSIQAFRRNTVEYYGVARSNAIKVTVERRPKRR